MATDDRPNAHVYLLDLATKRGYVTFDDILDVAEKFNLSDPDVDWLSSSIIMKGVIVYESPQEGIEQVNFDDETNEFDDYAQSDYDAIFRKVVELEPVLEPFIRAIKNIRPPQYKEISKLIHLAKEGNAHARERIILMQLRVAIRIALQRSIQFDTDLIECIGNACEGLVIALDKYDPNSSGAFISYASMWIYNNLSREQSNKRPSIYYPVHQKEQYNSMYPILKNTGCTLCDKVLSCKKVRNIILQKQECNEKQANDVVLQMIPLESLDSMYDALDKENQVAYDEVFVKHIIADDRIFERIYKSEFCRDVDSVVDSLKDRERLVIRSRYGFDGDDKTLEDIGNSLQVTRERIRQIESKAIFNLRKKDKLKRLYDSLSDDGL